MNTPIDLRQVTLEYPDGLDTSGQPRTATALDRVDFAAATSTMTALVGTSGSGKSSLLSVIGGLVTPTSGQVEVAGQDLLRLDAAGLARLRRDTVGIIFQQPNLLSSLTVVEQLLVTEHLRGLRGKKLRAKRTRAEELLAVVGLQDFSDRKVHQLSGGQRQRVNIARALMGSPVVLLADEPTSALDHNRSAEIMELLREVTTEFSVATMYVTHDSGLVEYADAQVQLRDGAVVSTSSVSSARPV